MRSGYRTTLLRCRRVSIQVTIIMAIVVVTRPTRKEVWPLRNLHLRNHHRYLTLPDAFSAANHRLRQAQIAYYSHSPRYQTTPDTGHWTRRERSGTWSLWSEISVGISMGPHSQGETACHGAFSIFYSVNLQHPTSRLASCLSPLAFSLGSIDVTSRGHVSVTMRGWADRGRCESIKYKRYPKSQNHRPTANRQDMEASKTGWQ